MTAGIFESVQPAHPQAPSSLVFVGKKDVRPEIPLLIYDDSQIVSVKAEKIQSDDTYYTIRIQSDE
jgi:hypothetical protein